MERVILKYYFWMAYTKKEDISMRNDKASIMADSVIDSLLKNFGKGATGFLIENLNENPNQKTFTIEFIAYEFYWVGVGYEKGRVTPYIVEGTHIIKMNNLADWWEEIRLDSWTDKLAEEIKLRIPDKYLKEKGWI